MSPHAEDPITTVDLSAFGRDGSPEARRDAARALRAACSALGAVRLTGLGLPEGRMDEALTWTKRLFDLPAEDKIKAPHPPTAMPHRGYSGPGREKVYSKAERDRDEAQGGQGAELRKIEDYKESYEVGSEANGFQPNVWLPEAVLPGYRAFALALYDDLHGAAMRVLEALCAALELSDADRARLVRLHSGQNNQLRLLHYPPVERARLAAKVIGRMPPHQDWSSFTMTFQDEAGGLEYLDPREKEETYVPARPMRGACILNVGDMLQRYSNGLFPSAMHRVTIPQPDASAEQSQSDVIGSRYSIPYFVAPDHEATVEVLDSCITKDRPSKYEPVRWCDYGEYMAKYMYPSNEGKEAANGNRNGDVQA